MKNRKIYFLVGTTAELLRIIPILNLLKKKNINFKLITSGQTEVLFDDVSEFSNNLKPDISLPEKVNKSSIFHFAIWSIRTFIKMTTELRSEFKGLNKENSYFVICGDPVTTSIGALAAYIYNLKIVHIESGDFSKNLREPFPEEICRNINVRLADILFPPSKWAKDNLNHINKPKINTYYNTMVEAFWWFMDRKVSLRKEVKSRKFYVLILHRQEHILFGKKWSKDTLKSVIDNAPPGLDCVLFNHPLTREIIKSLDIYLKRNNKKIILMPPVSYPEFLKLMNKSEFIATDGATNQFEAFLLGKPCLILRNHTEQIEGIGENVVLYQSNQIVLENFLSNYKKYRRKTIRPKVKPSKIIVDALIKMS